MTMLQTGKCHPERGWLTQSNFRCSITNPGECPSPLLQDRAGALYGERRASSPFVTRWRDVVFQSAVSWRVVENRVGAAGGRPGCDACAYDKIPVTAQCPPESRFSCSACGSPAVGVMADVHDGARVFCLRCGASVGTWADYREALSIQIRRISPAQLIASSLDMMM